MNLLFLVERGLLKHPILYLSRCILQHRTTYYVLLLRVSRDGTREAWEAWLLYMLEGVRETAQWTLAKIHAIQQLKANTRTLISQRTKLAAQQELVEIIFQRPYCHISDLVEEGLAGRQTASAYLKALVKAGFLEEKAAGREKLFVNPRLMRLLTSESNELEQIF